MPRGWIKGRPRSEETKRKISESLQGVAKGESVREALRARQGEVRLSMRGENHPLWKGDEASYSALHRRLYRSRGKARDYQCSQCGEEAKHWANLTGKYADLNDYEPMCVSCHRLYDYGRVAED